MMVQDPTMGQMKLVSILLDFMTMSYQLTIEFNIKRDPDPDIEHFKNDMYSESLHEHPESNGEDNKSESESEEESGSERIFYLHDEDQNLHFKSNYIKTTKYTFI